MSEPIEESGFKYDVAISLLDQDLAIATEIRDRLSDRLSVFLYSEKQLELVATDGVEKFSEVFRRDARVVVILSREQWGETKWTRIEQSAITSRALEAGWAFLVVATLERREGVPLWVPSTQIWGEYDRLGAAGAAAVIERKLGELGRDVRPETAEDLAARINRARDEESARLSFLASHDGLEAATAELERMAGELSRRAAGLGMHCSRDHHRAILLRQGPYQVSIAFQRKWGNSLRDSQLFIRLQELAPRHSIRGETAPRGPIERELEFDRRFGELGWSGSIAGTRGFVTSDNLIDRLLKSLLRAADGQEYKL